MLSLGNRRRGVELLNDQIAREGESALAHVGVVREVFEFLGALAN